MLTVDMHSHGCFDIKQCFKLDAEPYKDGLLTKMKDWDSGDSQGNIFKSHSNLVKNILQPMTKRSVYDGRVQLK